MNRKSSKQSTQEIMEPKEEPKVPPVDENNIKPKTDKDILGFLYKTFNFFKHLCFCVVRT